MRFALLFLLAALVLALASGCVEKKNDASDPSGSGAMPPTAAATTPPAAVSAPNPVVPVPLLIEIDGTKLRKMAAEIHIPQGEFRLVRLIYTAAVWGEKEPWDGSADVVIGVAWHTPASNATFMRAFGFEPFTEGDPIRPFVDFYPFSGDGWSYSITSSSCSGDGCGDVPAHETAWLVGASDGNVTLRIGVLPGDPEPEELWDRPALSVQQDVTTRDAWSGLGFQYTVLLQNYEATAGVLQVTHDAALVLPTGTSQQRTTLATASADIVEPGIFAASMYANDLLGLEQWAYTLSAPGMEAAWEGPWPHSPASFYLTLAGVLQPPRFSAQGDVGTGTVSLQVRRDFTGQDDPTGLGSLQYELIEIGHAGVRLGDLFGWDVERPPFPSSGMAMCERTSLLPGLARCIGDAASVMHSTH